MKIPKYIKQEMKNVVIFSNRAAFSMNVVEGWLEKQGIDTREELRSGDGCSLEELEYGNDVVELICEKLENL